MSQSINLIPQSEIVEQTKEKVIKFSTLLSILLLVLVGGVAAYFYYSTNKTKKEIFAKQISIEKYQEKIQGLSDIEVTARNLEGRFKKLDDLFSSRVKYSLLLRELKIRTSNAVVIQNLSFGLNNTLNVTGEGDDYIALAKFIKNVSDPKFSSASAGMGGLFTGVTLNTVSLENRTNKAQFFIVINYDRKLLNK